MAQSASRDEAAAIAAAIARFEAETGMAAGDSAPQPPPWQRAALVEGVSAKETLKDTQGGARWQS